MGCEGGAVLVSKRNCLFGAAGDGEEVVVMGLVATIAKVDHVLNRCGSIDSVFENVVRLGLADAETFRNPAWPVAVGKVSILSPVGMMRCCDQPGR